EPPSWDRIAEWVGELEELLAGRQEARIIRHLQRLVPEYSPADESIEQVSGTFYRMVSGSIRQTGAAPPSGPRGQGAADVPRRTGATPLPCELYGDSYDAERIA